MIKMDRSYLNAGAKYSHNCSHNLNLAKTTWMTINKQELKTRPDKGYSRNTADGCLLVPESIVHLVVSFLLCWHAFLDMFIFGIYSF
jgi:hypothetical protein